MEVGHRASLPGTAEGSSWAAMHPTRPSAGRSRAVRSRATAVAIAVALALAVTAACSGSSPTGVDAPPADSAVNGNATTVPAARPSVFDPAVERGKIVDEDVTESSGLVASRRHPGRLWTHNDSDQPPVLFCVEPDGASCGKWTVAGAENLDWEDIAAGPGPVAGEHYLYVGDIGDNVRERDDVVVYRVVEPTVPEAGAGDGGVTQAASALRYRFADGPHDAESVMVHPVTGDVYVVIKAADAGVYRGPPEGGTLTRVAVVGLGPLGLVSGADISFDGRRVVFCTPFGGFELTLDAAHAGPFDAIWARSPVAVALPPRSQGESVAYRLDGDALFLTSEGYPSPLFEVPRR